MKTTIKGTPRHSVTSSRLGRSSRPVKPPDLTCLTRAAHHPSRAGDGRRMAGLVAMVTPSGIGHRPAIAMAPTAAALPSFPVGDDFGVQPFRPRRPHGGEHGRVEEADLVGL